jgi:hypothetical protein
MTLAWPIVNEKSGGYNSMALVLAIFALYEQFTRSLSEKPSAPAHPSAAPASNATVPKNEAEKINPPLLVGTWLPSSLALGSLIFSLHKLLADSSTMIAWTWTGWPVSGPVPAVHGSATLAAQAVGILLSLALWNQAVPSSETTSGERMNDTSATSSFIALLQSPVWWLVGVLSSWVLYSFQDWTGYAGGLGLAVFLMSIIPVVVHQAAHAASVRGASMVFMTTWIAVSVLDFVDVMTVAYAFVSTPPD